MRMFKWYDTNEANTDRQRESDCRDRYGKYIMPGSFDGAVTGESE